MHTTMATENNNKNLNVPNLRFPEFSGEWQRGELKDVATLSKGSGISKDQLSDSGNPCILYGELYTKYKSEIIREVVSKTDIDSSGLVQSKVNDVIIPCSGEAAIEIATARCVTMDNILLGGDLNIIRLNGQDGGFFAYQLNGKRKVDIAKVAQGVSVVHLYGEHLKRVKVAYPSLDEQQKISSILTLLDERIATQNKIIEKLESLIRGLITDVNSGRIAQCKSVYLRDLLTEQHEKNTNNYEVCSVSVSQGVINQIDYLGRSFAAKEVLHYNVVNRGDIVYTKSPTGEFPYGIVKRSDITKPVAVSPLYGVYRPINDYVGRYLHLYFKSPINAKNYLHKLIQKGAKNTINITNQHFLDNKILIPEKGWLDKIVKFAAAIEMKIATENKVLQTLQQQKDYLLSKMFI